jgi:methylenetetrahydrofolate dehydrogenase (NADP+) / methenyltetrahydrofolate cyclohydrolase
MVGADGVELVVRSEREMLTLVATAAILEPVIGITTRHSLSMDPHLDPDVPKWGDSSEVVSRPVTATLMDGKALAATVRGEVTRDVAALGVPVGLATVLVGEDPASAIYVRMKREACAEAGIESIHHELSADTSEADLLALVADLNADPRVTGILTQLPLPEQIDEDRVINAIDPMKDVDGFHPANAGFLLQGRPTLVAATPSGVMEILRHYEVELEGARAVVVGRSNIVGKPMALLLLAENATVTLAHSRTRDLGSLVREADVVVAAVGRAGMITAEMVRPGATVIDVGINRVDGKVVGDVAEDVREVAGLLTPVPGGVGPMTIAALLRNTVRAARYQSGDLAFPLR